jgi:hypothetical protein
MTLSQILTPSVEKAVHTLFDMTIDKVEFQLTRKEFEGDITMVIFPLLKIIKSYQNFIIDFKIIDFNIKFINCFAKIDFISRLVSFFNHLHLLNL